NSTEPQPQPSPNNAARRTLRSGELDRTSRSCGTVRQTSAEGRTMKPRKQNTSQVFSHSHSLVYFIGTTKLPCIRPAETMSTSAERFMVDLPPLCSSAWTPHRQRWGRKPWRNSSGQSVQAQITPTREEEAEFYKWAITSTAPYWISP